MIIWKTDLEADKSRNEGRKIAQGLAIKNPRLKEISEAAQNLDLAPEIEKKVHPNGTKGRVNVDKKHSKIKTLKLIADEIRRIRKE